MSREGGPPQMDSSMLMASGAMNSGQGAGNNIGSGGAGFQDSAVGNAKTVIDDMEGINTLGSVAISAYEGDAPLSDKPIQFVTIEPGTVEFRDALEIKSLGTGDMGAGNLSPGLQTNAKMVKIHSGQQGG